MSVQFSDMEGHTVVETELCGVLVSTSGIVLYMAVCRGHIWWVFSGMKIVCLHIITEGSGITSFSFLFTLCPYTRCSIEY